MYMYITHSIDFVKHVYEKYMRISYTRIKNNFFKTIQKFNFIILARSPRNALSNDILQFYKIVWQHFEKSGGVGALALAPLAR